MLTSPKLKSQVDALWDKLWSGGLSNADLYDLYDPPLTSFGEDAVERLFSEEQIDDVLSFAEKLAIKEICFYEL
jgi:hypothetical protein